MGTCHAYGGIAQAGSDWMRIVDVNTGSGSRPDGRGGGLAFDRSAIFDLEFVWPEFSHHRAE